MSQDQYPTYEAMTQAIYRSDAGKEMYEAEQKGIRAQARAISRLFDVLQQYPFLWTLGDGEGGSLFESIADEAMVRGLQGPDLEFSYPRRGRKAVLEALAERDGWCCRYCDTSLAPDTYLDGPHIDHVVPKVRGGSNRLDNLALACASCNRRKGTKSATRFEYEMAGLL